MSLQWYFNSLDLDESTYSESDVPFDCYLHKPFNLYHTTKSWTCPTLEHLHVCKVLTFYFKEDLKTLWENEKMLFLCMYESFILE